MLESNDIIEIQQLEAFCHHAVDHPDQSLFSQVFTEDAIFDGRLAGGPRYVGLDDIMGFFALGKPPHPASHHMTNCWVYEEGGEVRVKSKWMVPNRETGGMFCGENNDRVVLTDKGWRIKERVARQVFPEDLAASVAAGD